MPLTDEQWKWINDHPHLAVEKMPEVVSYLRWRGSRFVQHFVGEPKFDHFPRRFTTQLGEEVQ